MYSLLLLAAMTAIAHSRHHSSSATPITIPVELGTASAFNEINPNYVGFTLSFMGNSSKSNPQWDDTSILVIDLTDSTEKGKDFTKLVAGLAPGLLRVGGGDEYPIVMDVDGLTCAKLKTPSYFCLTMERWAEILAFAKRTGVQLVWGIGAQVGRPDGTSQMDFDLAITPFLEYTAKLGPEILCSHNKNGGGLLGFEFGNELDAGDYLSGIAVLPRVFAKDYKTLRGIFDRLWPTRGDVMLVGPAMHLQATWARKFFAELGFGVLDLFTFHNYVGYGLDPKLGEKLMSRKWLDAYWEQAAPVIALAKSLQPGADLVVGETSAAWHSGRCGVTDVFNGCFWYANALGRMARGGVQAVERHSFNGGCYRMITQEMEPNPDYWLAKMFRDLMGEAVLDIRQVGASSLNLNDNLLMFAHMSKRWPSGSLGNSTGHGATYMLVNIDPTETFELEMSGSVGLSLPRYEYHFDGGVDGLQSSVVNVNGNELRYQNNSKTLPDITNYAKLVTTSTTGIQIGPRSIVFIEAPDAMVY